MRKALFVKDIEHPDPLIGELTGETLVIYSDVYNVETKYPKILWSEFKNSYVNYQPDNIIVVGLNRIRTPETRYDLVYPYIYNMNRFKVKITIDNRPFTGEPWRLWYHYGFLYGTWLGVSYSNVLESNWAHWFYRDADSATIAAENIRGHITDTWSDLEPLTTCFEFYEPDPLLKEYYLEVKEAAFEKYSTPKQLIQFMLKHLNKHCHLDISYETYLTSKKYKLPDFGIFRFMAEENRRRMDIYNTVIKVCKKYEKGI